MVEIAASDAVNAQMVKNSGTITADGGVIQLQAAAAKNVVDALVSNSGTLQAASAEEKNGVIILGGSKTHTEISGTLDVSGQNNNETGGRIEITGKKVDIQNATIDASGTNGGGDIRIGGGYKGGEDIYRSNTTTVDLFTRITADATENGNGGSIVVWSDDLTDIAGTLSAKGGAQSGDGGLLETSGKTNLRMVGTVDTSAVNGDFGTWLVDPANITINAAAGASDGVNTFNRTYLEAQLANIILTADTNITLSLSGETVTLQNNIGLTLNAGQDIITTSSGTIRTSGTGSVVFAATRDVKLTHALNVNVAGTGSVTFRADRQVSSTAAGSITTQGGDIILNADRDEVGGGNIVLTNVIATSNGGDIVLGGGNDPYAKAAQGYSGAVSDVTLGGSTLNSAGGDISIRGAGYSAGVGAGNYGVYIQTASLIQSTFGSITINGLGGNGTTTNYGVYLFSANTRISSVNGSISITAVAGNGSSNNNYGYYQTAGTIVESTGTNADGATITINGTGGNGTAGNHGVYVIGTNTRLSSVNGAMLITGVGGNGSGADNYGYYQNTGAVVESTGTSADGATITINGTGGNSTSNNHGVYIVGANTRLSSINGDISITGTGGNGTANTHYGYYQNTAPVVQSTGIGADAATITINGMGGNGVSTNYGVHLLGANTRILSVDGNISITGVGRGSGSTNYGYQQNTGAVVQSTGTSAYAATIMIHGTGSNSGASNNIGVYLIAASTRISTVDGNISITGTGGNASGNTNAGYSQATGAIIESTGTTSNAGTITIHGTGNNSASNNHGVRISNANTRVSSINGDISITGIGKGITTSNYGYVQSASAVVESTGTGADAATITINGTAGDGNGALNMGIFFLDANTRISSVDGDISLTGQGGNGTGSDGHGYFQYAGALLYSTGVGANAAKITITGTGGEGGSSSNMGVRIATASTEIISVDGDITISAIGGKGTISSNHGFLHEESKIRSTGVGADAANITISGTSGAGTDNNVGLYLNMANTEISSVDGNITLSGVVGTGTNTYGMYFNGAVQVTTQNAASVMTFASDTSINAINNPVLSAAGDVAIRPMTSGNNLVIGNVAGVSHEFINALSWGGTLYLGAYNNVLAARTISFEGNTVFNGPVVAQANNSMIFSTGASVTANSVGDALTLSSAIFTNNAGANALSTPNGRWLVYSTSPNTDKKDGLTSQFTLYNCSYGGACALGAGNGYIYRNAKTVSVKLPMSVETGRNISVTKPTTHARDILENVALLTLTDTDGLTYNVDITHSQISSDASIDFDDTKIIDSKRLMRNFYKVYFTKDLLQQLGFHIR